MTLEHKTIPFEVKEIDSNGLVRGYASIYSNVDYGGDVIEPGAFKTSLAEIAGGTRSVKMLWQHDPGQPIGIWDSFQDDAKGLMAQGRILAGVSRGKDAIELLRAKAVDGLSIGYRTVEQDWQTAGEGRVRLIKSAELWEVSVVTFPMNPAARITDVKKLETIRDVERVLRDAGVPANFAKLVASHGFDEAKARLAGDRREDGSEEAKAQALSSLLTKLQRLKETINA